MSKPQIPPGSDLSIQQELALSALLAGHSVADSADQAGASIVSVRRWLSKPGPFVRELHARLAERRRQAEAGLGALLPPALQAIRSVLLEGQHESSKIAAAKLVLEHVMASGLYERTLKTTADDDVQDEALAIPELRAVLEAVAKRQEGGHA